MYLFLLSKKTNKVVTPYKCQINLNDKKACEIKAIRWRDIKSPLFDVNKIIFLKTVQWKCTTHKKIFSISNNCQISNETELNIKSIKIGHFRVTKEFIDFCSKQHQYNQDYSIQKTIQSVYNHYASIWIKKCNTDTIMLFFFEK